MQMSVMGMGAEECNECRVGVEGWSGYTGVEWVHRSGVGAQEW